MKLQNFLILNSIAIQNSGHLSSDNKNGHTLDVESRAHALALLTWVGIRKVVSIAFYVLIIFVGWKLSSLPDLPVPACICTQSIPLWGIRLIPRIIEWDEGFLPSTQNHPKSIEECSSSRSFLHRLGVKIQVVHDKSKWNILTDSRILVHLICSNLTIHLIVEIRWLLWLKRLVAKIQEISCYDWGD